MTMTERFRTGDVLALPVPSGTKSGDPLRIGVFNCVALTDRADTSVDPFNADGTPNAAYNRGGGNKDGEATVTLIGVHDVPIGTTTAMAVLDTVYITSGNALTPVASGNKAWGVILEAKGTTAGEVHPVRLIKNWSAA